MTTPSNPADHDGLPLLSREGVLRLVAQGHHAPVAELPTLPNDGGGEGDANLYFFPTPTAGDTTEQHRDTWAVVVDFPDVAEDVEDCSTHATEQEARDDYRLRVAARLGERVTAPSEPEPMDPEDFLAAQADLPLLDYDRVLDVIATEGHQPRAVLERLPDDGLGEGDAYLYCIPARAHGDLDLRHRQTWVVSVVYDENPDGGWDLFTGDTEKAARTAHSGRVADRIAAGWPDPNI